MTANQLNYWANRETRRHNLAQERENYRSNKAREDETLRSNVAKETENSRHNKRTESLEAEGNRIKNYDAVTKRGDFYRKAFDSFTKAVDTAADNAGGIARNLFNLFQ